MNSEDDISQAFSRKDREREQHRTDILEAAERVFVRDGAATKIESIAREAEFAVGSLYNFFPSKDDLFRNVLLRISQQRVDDLAEALAGRPDDPRESLARVVRLWLAHHLRHGDFLHIAMARRPAGRGGLLPPDDPVEAELRKNGEAYRRRLTAYFAGLAASPGVRPLSPDVMFVAFEGYVRTSLFRARWEGDGRVDAAALGREVLDALVQLFCEEEKR